MAMNEEGRQTEVAAELSEAARTLAHSTRNVPNSADSYALLADLSDTIRSLRQVADQLGMWHANAVEGAQFDGEDGRGDGRACEHVEMHLHNASKLLRNAGTELDLAHAANGRIRWIGH